MWIYGTAGTVDDTAQFQWTFVAVYMYSEIAFIFLLLLPCISPSRWQEVFRTVSEIINRLSVHSHIYVNVFIAILLLLFFDALRQVKKYAGQAYEVDLKLNPDSESVAHMRLFRAQRNLYIAGFALFLWFIIRRLIALMSAQAQLVEQAEASQKQAQSTSEAARKLMEEKENLSNLVQADDKDLAQQLMDVKEELSKSKTALQKKELELSALKKQSEGTHNEYDRQVKEMETLQASSNSQGDKKSN